MLKNLLSYNIKQEFLISNIIFGSKISISKEQDTEKTQDQRKGLELYIGLKLSRK